MNKSKRVVFLLNDLRLRLRLAFDSVSYLSSLSFIAAIYLRDLAFKRPPANVFAEPLSISSQLVVEFKAIEIGRESAE